MTLCCKSSDRSSAFCLVKINNEPSCEITIFAEGQYHHHVTVVVGGFDHATKTMLSLLFWLDHKFKDENGSKLGYPPKIVATFIHHPIKWCVCSWLIGLGPLDCRFSHLNHWLSPITIQNDPQKDQIPQVIMEKMTVVLRFVHHLIFLLNVDPPKKHLGPYLLRPLGFI